MHQFLLHLAFYSFFLILLERYKEAGRYLLVWLSAKCFCMTEVHSNLPELLTLAAAVMSHILYEFLG